jgi:hypothetical protein
MSWYANLTSSSATSSEHCYLLRQTSAVTNAAVPRTRTHMRASAGSTQRRVAWISSWRAAPYQCEVSNQNHYMKTCLDIVCWVAELTSRTSKFQQEAHADDVKQVLTNTKNSSRQATHIHGYRYAPCPTSHSMTVASTLCRSGGPSPPARNNSPVQRRLCTIRPRVSGLGSFVPSPGTSLRIRACSCVSPDRRLHLTASSWSVFAMFCCR